MPYIRISILTLLLLTPIHGCKGADSDSAKGSDDEGSKKKAKKKKDPPSPKVVCAKVFELLEDDMKGKKDDEKKFMEAMMKAFKADCTKEASKTKDDDPDAYAKAAECVMDASTLEAAMKCDFGKSEAKQNPAKACSFTGTYSGRRTRSKDKPGSCDAGYPFEKAIPVRISADPTASSGYKVEVGYSNPAGSVVYANCKNNVLRESCTVFATCEPTAGLDQVTLKIDGDGISGTIERSAEEKCTINFNLSGSRT